jgi:hypothetical protein
MNVYPLKSFRDPPKNSSQIPRQRLVRAFGSSYRADEMSMISNSLNSTACLPLQLGSLFLSEADTMVPDYTVEGKSTQLNSSFQTLPLYRNEVHGRRHYSSAPNTPTKQSGSKDLFHSPSSTTAPYATDFN